MAVARGSAERGRGAVAAVPGKRAALVLPSYPLSFEWHVGFEVGVSLAGEQRRFHSDFEYTLYPGDVWLNPMWEPHGWIIPESGQRAVSITFLPEFLGEEMLGDCTWLSLFAVPPSQRPRVTEEMRARVLALGEELFEEAREARPKWRVAVRINLLKLFFMLSREWQPPAEVTAPRLFSRRWSDAPDAGSQHAARDGPRASP